MKIKERKKKRNLKKGGGGPVAGGSRVTPTRYTLRLPRYGWCLVFNEILSFLTSMRPYQVLTGGHNSTS